MEVVDKDPEVPSEDYVVSENQEAKSGAEEDSSEEFRDLPESQIQEEEVEDDGKLIIPQRIINLRRDLPTLVTNIQTAADAKESLRRTDLEKARALRLEMLENDVKSSRDKFEEITSGWSTAKQKVIPQELQAALNDQQKLCAALIEDKKNLINDLHQELKVGDDLYIKDLRKQAEELDLMMERMEEQIKTLTKAYREELAQIERVYQQESELLLTKDKADWENHMTALWDDELERLRQRMTKVEEYEATIHNLMLDTADKYNIALTEQNERFQVLERESEKTKATTMLMMLKQIKQKDEIAVHRFSLAHMKSRLVSMQTEMKNLKSKYANQMKQFTKRSRFLSEDHQRNIQQYDRIQLKIKHFAAADARKFEDMWLMIEAEVKQKVERALVIDSLICKYHLGLAWERPAMPFMELSGPIQPQKQAWRPAGQSSLTGQELQHSQRTMDACVGPRLETDTESTDTEMYKAETALQSESGTEVELSNETLKKVMELLCDEAGFLMEDKLLLLLAPMEKEEQIFVKLSSLLRALGIGEEDLPKLANFLLRHKHQQIERIEAQEDFVESESSERVDPNLVVPALKSFLRQLTRSRESSTRVQTSSQQVEARDASGDEAFWESMGNIISEDKLKLWDIAENTLKQYHEVLTEISDLIPETQKLEQQNAELRLLLQQSLDSAV